MTCLLCLSPAVADGLCVPCGARLWAAELWRDDYAEALDLQATIIAAGVVPPRHIERAKALVEHVPTRRAAEIFLGRLDAARAERKRAEDARIARRDGVT
jgi:hypothetical protein